MRAGLPLISLKLSPLMSLKHSPPMSLNLFEEFDRRMRPNDATEGCDAHLELYDVHDASGPNPHANVDKDDRLSA
jgi:hypothetical protein